MTCMAARRGLQTGTARQGRAQEDQALPLRRPLPLVTRASSPPGRGPVVYTIVTVRIEYACIPCLKFRV